MGAVVRSCPPARTPQQRAGDAAEALVVDALAAQGWAMLGRNLRVGRRELDIVAVDPGPPAALVIVEVRWRRDRAFGLPEETVDWRKRRHLRHAAAALLERGLPDGSRLPPLPLRFDLIVVEPAGMRHHRFAVEA
jgi:Holliday junction resolvase-like predicted endonuclease